MPAQLAIVLPAAAIVLSGLAIWQIASLRRRLSTILGSTDSAQLEQALKDYHAGVKQVDSKLAKLLDAFHKLSESASLASQKISVVRFNPFGDTGGDQSFVLAVLDAHNSGYVLTSIHGREGTRVYVKPIDYGRSKYTLSQEEKQALDQASRRVPLTEAAHA
jgi:hypothetical protein